MLKLSEQEVLQHIATFQQFECELNDGSLFLKIEHYSPVICTAIHAGHRFRSDLHELCLLDAQQRLYEEDPFTDMLIQAMPITLVANDSRYEYDLNRPIANCIYTRAWGQTVWRKPLSAKLRNQSVAKHQAFYRILDALISALEQRFGATLLFDIHSFNYLRHSGHTPTFNIGTEQINMDRWGGTVKRALKQLQAISLPNLPVDAAENSVFFGRGYMISHVNSRFQNTLVIPLEVKKIFMDELSGEQYPLVLMALIQQLKSCFIDVSAAFARRFTSQKRAKKFDMLTETLDPMVVKVDRSLYRLAKGLDTLHYINPINTASEKRRFLRSHGRYTPQFKYRPLNISPYLFKEQLYRLPVDAIRDPSIQALYRDVVDSLGEKISMLVSAGQPDFIYQSLKYYGEPSQTDINNAHFLLHAQGFEAPEPETIDSEQLVQRFKVLASQWDMRCKIEISTKLVASAMVSNSRKTVYIAKNLSLNETQANALIHHELGVHMATTLNAALQPLKVFAIGLPGNTLTQEGLAILNEFQSGNMGLIRLKGLALRVLAVREMVRYGDFRHTFNFLKEQHHLSDDAAFTLALRVHRGGGFSKDYLYLNGVGRAMALASTDSLSPLYIGKTGFDYLPVIKELIERQLIPAPRFYPAALSQPHAVSPELAYLMACIRPSDAMTRLNHYAA